MTQTFTIADMARAAVAEDVYEVVCQWLGVSGCYSRSTEEYRELMERVQAALVEAYGPEWGDTDPLMCAAPQP